MYSQEISVYLFQRADGFHVIQITCKKSRINHQETNEDMSKAIDWIYKWLAVYDFTVPTPKEPVEKEIIEKFPEEQEDLEDML